MPKRIDKAKRSNTMQRLGETQTAKELLKTIPTKPLDIALAKLAVEISEHPDAVEKAFMARELVQCTLPHSDPGNVPVWTRRNGDLVLAIQPGVKDDLATLHGYPFGTIPRLLLYWIVSEAKLTNSRRIYPGRRDDGSPGTLSDFMRQLGLDPSRGGKRSDRRRLEDGANRLFSSRISFHRSTRTDAFSREQTVFMEVASARDLWWSSAPNQGLLWESWIELGEKFFDAVTAATVPVDLRVVRGVKNSALALDLYSWACHRAYTVNKSGKSAKISWESLMTQFGSEYADPKEFGRKARAALTKIKALWRKFDNGRSGLLLEFEKGIVALRPGSLLSVLEEPQRVLADSRA